MLKAMHWKTHGDQKNTNGHVTMFHQKYGAFVGVPTLLAYPGLVSKRLLANFSPVGHTVIFVSLRKLANRMGCTDVMEILLLHGSTKYY